VKTTNQRQPYAEGYCSVCGEYTKFGKLTGRGLECPKECPPVKQPSTAKRFSDPNRHQAIPGADGGLKSPPSAKKGDLR